MDSFLAAADNLDQLLDDLEENEDEGSPKEKNAVSPIQQAPESSFENRENTSNHLPQQIPEPAVVSPISTSISLQNITNDNVEVSEVKNGLPESISQEENVKYITETQKRISPTLSPTSFYDDLEQSDMTQPQKINMNMYVNANNLSPKAVVLDTTNPVISEPNKLLSGPYRSNSNDDFVIVENKDNLNSSEPDVTRTNSELLMELFGAVPNSNQTEDNENSQIGENGTLSPLNPFNIDLMPSIGNVNDNAKAQIQPAGIFSWENMDKLGQHENDSELVLEENGLSGAPVASNPFYDATRVTYPQKNLNGPAFLVGIQKSKSKDIGIELPEQTNDAKFMESINQQMVNKLNENSVTEQVDLVPNQIANFDVSSPKKTSNIIKNNIKPDDPSSPKIQKLVEDSVENNTEKQETLSAGFMKDVAVTEEEFEKFLAEMEEDDCKKTPENIAPDKIMPNTAQNCVTDLTAMQPSITGAGNAISNMQNGLDKFTPNPVAIHSSPDNQGVLIESENVITHETPADEIVTAPNADSIHVVTSTAVDNVSLDMSTLPVAVPTDNTQLTISNQQGSPTFPLRRRMVPINDMGDRVITETEHSGPNERLHLNIDRPEPTGQEQSSGSKYPNTPPPPYTQQMHEVYEQSLPPRHHLPDQQPMHEDQSIMFPDAEQQNQTQSSDVENDFSLLPSAILDSITRPGNTKPTWVPDHDAPQCSNCAAKFTFTRRRHHCRACGRVYCASCCNERSQLKYMDYKEARVCSMCSLAIKQADALAEMAQRAAAQATVSSNSQPLAEEAVDATNDPALPPQPGIPSNPAAETTLEAEEVVMDERTLPTEAVNIPPSTNTEEDMEVEGAFASTPNTKSVRFSDGTRPKHPDEMPSTPPPPSRMNRVRKKHGHYTRDPNALLGQDLPPIIIAHGENGAFAVQENPDANVVTDLLESGGQTPQSFVLNPNLIINIKFISYANRQCWCFWSKGMDGVGQREVVLILEREGLGDRLIPHDAFTFFTCIFDRARKGKMFNTTDFMPTTMLGFEDGDELFGMKENAGFMFVQSSSQPLDGLACLKKKLHHVQAEMNGVEDNLPIRSMLFAILVQKTEAPWATLFPMRLMLRLGKETKQYPCPLFSVRRRQPVYHELGHTILGILCDFRNFKYRVVSVPGLRVVVTSNGHVSVQIPCNRFSDSIKIMNSSNESVLAIGTGTFGPKIRSKDEMGVPCDGPCESHLVCVQDQQNSSYHTEILNMKNTQASNTGAAFVIFNGSLKTDGTNSAKCAIVEDGIMIQLLPEKMEELRASLKSMEDFRLRLGPNVNSEAEDSPQLEVKWVEDDTAFNIGMFSPIDGTPFEGVVGFNVQGRSEQKGRKHTLRWNQVFFLASTSDPLDMSRLAEQVANGCFLALTPVLHELARHRQHKIAVRVTIHPENVGYVAGSGLKDLPIACMNALDENLIQTIHSAANSVPVEQEAVIIELLFSILLSRPGYRTA